MNPEYALSLPPSRVVGTGFVSRMTLTMLPSSLFLAPVGDHLLERLAVADLEALLALVLAEGAQLDARHGLARRDGLLDLEFGVHLALLPF